MDTRTLCTQRSSRGRELKSSSSAILGFYLRVLGTRFGEDCFGQELAGLGSEGQGDRVRRALLRAARFVRDEARSSSDLVDPARGTTGSAQMSGKYSQVGCCRGVVPTCCGCRVGFLFWRCTGAGRGGRVGQGGPGLPLPGSRAKVGQICKSRRTPSLPAHQRNRRGARQGAGSAKNP